MCCILLPRLVLLCFKMQCALPTCREQKCVTSAEMPLVKEVTTTLREWGSIWKHLYVVRDFFLRVVAYVLILLFLIISSIGQKMLAELHFYYSNTFQCILFIKQ